MTDAATPDITDCLKTVSLDGALVHMDYDGMCLMEIDDFSTVDGKPWASLWPEDAQSLVEQSVAQACSGKVARFSASCPTAKGTPKSWEVSVSPIRNEAGEIVALQSLSHDITRREFERHETRLVARELSHRIKNLFAVVDSLISLSSRHQPETVPFVAALRQRVTGLSRAIAFIHPAEGGDAPTPTTVTRLIEALVEPYRGTGATIEVSGDEIAVSADAVTSLALVINELATNALKYGALREATGLLAIVVARRGKELLIRWSEIGPEISTAETLSGFGTQLLDRTVRGQLGGAVDRSWSPTGLKADIVIPLHNLG